MIIMFVQSDEYNPKGLIAQCEPGLRPRLDRAQTGLQYFNTTVQSISLELNLEIKAELLKFFKINSECWLDKDLPENIF